jgi:outer membrane protein
MGESPKYSLEERRMKKAGFFIINWIAGMALVSVVWAADPAKVGFVDMQRALNLCEAGQEAKKAMSVEVDKVQKTLEAKQKELNKLRDDLEKRGSVMNESVRREKEKDYQAKLRDLQRLQRDFDEDFRRRDREYTDKVLRDLAKIVQTIGEEGKYTVILEPNQPTIIYISKGLDLTDEVIKQANAPKPK